MANTVTPTVIYRHRYIITDVTMTAGKAYIIDPDHIGSIQFQYDYLNRRLPVIKLSVSLTEAEAKALYDNLDTAKISIEILDKYLDSSDDVINSKIFVHDTFDIIPATGADEYTGDAASEFDTLDPLYNIMSLYLVKNERIQWLDKEIATIFSKTDKAGALVSLFSMRGIPSKTCIITPPKTNSTIDRLVLPLGNLVENVDTINKQYGLWPSSAVIFDDYTYIYCIDRNNPNIILPRATDYDTVVFMVPSSDNENLVATGSSDDSKNRCHYVNLPISPSIEDNSNTTTKTEFGTIASIDSNGTVVKTTVDENSPKMKFVRSRNDLTVSQYLNDRISSPITVNLVVTDESASIFKPYKIYRFKVEETNSMYETLNSKVFRLAFVSTTLKKKSDYFEPYTVVNLSVVDG